MIGRTSSFDLLSLTACGEYMLAKTACYADAAKCLMNRCHVTIQVDRLAIELPKFSLVRV